MRILRFDRWCSLAVSGIRFKPDRKEVYEELYAHMEDQYAELTAGGYSKQEAEEEVTAAMGDPGETARQLELIHRPFWGCALRAARWCLILSAVLALFILPRYIKELNLHDFPETDAYFGEDRENAYGTDQRIYYAEPRVKARSDGYVFTVTQVAERRRVSEAYGEDAFYLRVEVRSLRPWTVDSDVLREFTAADSLGNTYAAFNHVRHQYDTPTLIGNYSRSGLFTYTWTLWLSGYRSQEAEWIELRYNRSGRDVRLTVDLSGRKGAAE